jgi:hypothetical protein
MAEREGAQKTCEGEQCEMPLCSAGCGMEKGEKTCLLPDSTVERRSIDVPQSEHTREYFRPANNVDIHHQHRHGFSAIERTWRTKGWNQRLFQTVMGKGLENDFLSFKFYTGQSPSLRDIWRRRCAQTRRRRPTMLPRAGPELKSSQEFRKAPWHHHRRVSNMPWSKGHLSEWAAYGSRDHATCARSVTQMECAKLARKDWILILPSRFGCVRLALVDANAIASICTKCRFPESRKMHFSVFSAHAEALLNGLIHFLQKDRKK